MNTHKMIAAAAAVALATLAAPAAAADRSVGERYFVGFDRAPERAVVERHGGDVLEAFPEIGALVVRMTNAAAAELSRARGVAYVEPDVARQPLGLADAQLVPSLSNGLYGLVATKATAAHARGRTGSGIRACLADTGVDYTHPDIAPAYRAGIDTVDDDNDPTYANPGSIETHGTHVAGTLVAANNASGIVGVAHGAELYHARVGNHAVAWASDMMDGVRWLVETAKCKVVNVSFGGPSSSKTELNFYKSMRSKGALVVAAAGNGGSTSVSYPAAYSVNVAVGAVDRANAHLYYSNTGTNLDLSAPGDLVLSSFPAGLGSEASVTTASGEHPALELAGAGRTAGTSGTLVDCGLSGIGECPEAVAGNVALIQRVDYFYDDQITNAMNAGAVAAIVYNNEPGELAGALADPTTITGEPWIPVVTVSDAAGAALRAQLGGIVTVRSGASSWEYHDGTSIAAPFVTGAIALVWSVNPLLTNTAVEDHVFKSAKDLGAAGYDTIYGHGLVNAEAAVIRAGG